MNISKFTQKSIEAVQNMEKVAATHGNQQIEQIHLLASLLDIEGSLIVNLIKKMGINEIEFRNEVEAAIEKLPKVSGGQSYIGNDLNKICEKLFSSHIFMVKIRHFLAFLGKELHLGCYSFL